MTFAGEALGCVRGERQVFAGLDFACERGGAIALEGPNGSGKSSLLRLCALLLQPAAGRLAWEGRDIAEDAEAHRRRIVYVGHLDALKPALTVRENLAFWADLAGAAATATEAALARIGLAHLGGLPARFLSAGQRRRLNLARLLLRAAPLWLLDEPATSLDSGAAATLAAIIAEHRAAGGIVVAAMHGGLLLGDALRLRLGAETAAA
ncbi:MAG TPA: heme ABC exporter ATP-binding protein CcmA [Candidatus Sulfotelmatobacter sp.]|nr:heme ABC exporter ATP-binding protein CcmA [Candidatus Sulfotelmatobacter sp.]